MHNCKMRIITLLLVTVSLGVMTSALTTEEECDLCKAVATALKWAVTIDTPEDELKDVTISRCKALLNAEGLGHIAQHCSTYYSNNYAAILTGIENGDSITTICTSACSSDSIFQSREGFHTWLGMDKGRYDTHIQSPPSADNSIVCDTCKDVAAAMIKKFQQILPNAVMPTPQSLCEELYKCPKVTMEDLVERLLYNYLYNR